MTSALTLRVEERAEVGGLGGGRARDGLEEVVVALEERGHEAQERLLDRRLHHQLQ